MISATPPPEGCRDLSWPDDWTVTTTDGANSAAAEETLLITPTGVEILTAEGGPRSLDTREQREKLGLLRAKEKLAWEEEKAGAAGQRDRPTNAEEGDEQRDGKRAKVDEL